MDFVKLKGFVLTGIGEVKIHTFIDFEDGLKRQEMQKKSPLRGGREGEARPAMRTIFVHHMF